MRVPGRTTAPGADGRVAGAPSGVAARARAVARPVIQLERISRTYQMGEIQVHALREVSLRVERGEFVAVMGQSGSGKSTMMNILGCLDVANRGRYFLDGVDVRQLDEDTLARARNRKIGFVFQSFNLIPRTSALANVELPMVYAGVRPKERQARARAALEMVGLGTRMHHLPNEMSGGQQQRAAVARAIATNPSLILADEPTGNLDTQSSEEVMAIFRRLNAEGRTVVLITHEPEIAAVCRRTVRLRDGSIVSDTATQPTAVMPSMAGGPGAGGPGAGGTGEPAAAGPARPAGTRPRR
jgi:putative ABC transport system ATP-binding protein